MARSATRSATGSVQDVGAKPDRDDGSQSEASGDAVTALIRSEMALEPPPDSHRTPSPANGVICRILPGHHSICMMIPMKLRFFNKPHRVGHPVAIFTRLDNVQAGNRIPQTRFAEFRFNFLPVQTLYY